MTLDFALDFSNLLLLETQDGLIIPCEGLMNPLRRSRFGDQADVMLPGKYRVEAIVDNRYSFRENMWFDWIARGDMPDCFGLKPRFPRLTVDALMIFNERPVRLEFRRIKV